MVFLDASDLVECGEVLPELVLDMLSVNAFILNLVVLQEVPRHL